MSNVIDFKRSSKELKVRYRINVDSRKRSRVDCFQNDIEDDPDQYHTIWIDARSLEEAESLRLQGLQMLKVGKSMVR